MSAPLVFVDDLDAPELSRDDRHHLERSLRMRAGDEIVVADGVGRWRPAVLGPVIAVTGPVVTEVRAQPAITVVFAPVKGDRPEWLVAKLTELGVDRIVPMTTERSVVRWDGAHDLSRLRRAAREAAMQSRQARLPEIGAPVMFATAARIEGACRADFGGGRPSLAHPVVLIGPEGGWSDAERAADLPTVALGNTVLRAETAAVAAATMLASVRAGLLRAF
jgi:16S rRNA (uracil1498-N3)-methyltransferase